MIKKIFFLATFYTLTILLCSFVKPKEVIKESAKTGIVFFNGTWKEVLQKAKAENKIIFLDIYATWCGPCKKLKNKTFSNSKVGAYFNEHFINVSIDGEIGEGITLAEKYKLTAYPTLFFIDGDANIKKGAVGYYNPAQILRLAKSLN